MNKELMFSSKSDEWATPQWLFDELDEEFDFTLDVCASDSNNKCSGYYTIETDGLSKNWQCPIDGTVAWMNPPYSEVKLWIKKAYEECDNGVTTVALVPSRTDTKWFHEYCYNKPNVEIRFLKGRLKFGDSKNSAPFPSMIIIFKPINNGR